MPNVAIVGCGRIGCRRAAALAGATLTVCCDLDFAAAEDLARLYPGAEPSDNWCTAVSSRDVDIVIVATPHDILAPVALAAAYRSGDCPGRDKRQGTEHELHAAERRPPP